MTYRPIRPPRLTYVLTAPEPYGAVSFTISATSEASARGIATDRAMPIAIAPKDWIVTYGTRTF